jgi:hypothetical protein
MPVVAVAVAAPAFAASPGSAPQLAALGGCRCGTGGGTTKPYRLDATFTNATTQTFAITDVTITVSGTPGASVTLLSANNEVPPGSKVLQYRFTRGSNPTSDAVRLTWTATDTTTNETFTGDVTLNVTWATCTAQCVG